MRKQRGVSALIVTLLILAAIAIGTYGQFASTALEARMTGNDLQGRKAAQSAQAGVDFLLAGLQAGKTASYICDQTKWDQYRFELDFGDVACAAFPFEIITKIERVRSYGYSSPKQASGKRDGGAVRVYEVTVDLTTSWNYISSAATVTGVGTGPIKAKGNVSFGGTPEAAECNLTGAQTCSSLAGSGNVTGIITPGKILVDAGGSISESGSVPMDSSNYNEGNASLQNMSTDQFFTQFAGNGLNKSQFGSRAFQYTPPTSGSGQVDADSVSTSNQLIQVNGDLTLRNGTLGSPERPVVLYVNGSLNLAGNVNIWGVVYATNAEFSAGTNKIFGSLLSEQGVDMKGNAAVYYNAGLRPDPNTVDPASLLAEQVGKKSTVRVGSWRELTIPSP
jgi:hypothetical protein